MFRTTILIIGAASITLGSGCALFRVDSTPSYKTVVTGPQRDTEEARKCNDKAIRSLAEDDLVAARQQADKALIANVDFAPAHNTLGKILFRQGDYYLAAWEYQFAIQLQPDMPEYHNNLGLIYEAADRLKEAVPEFQAAVDFEPDNYHFISNLARAKVRQGETSPETAALLRDVVFLDPRKEWKDWAGELLKTSHLDQPDGYLNYLPNTDGFPNGVSNWGSLKDAEPVSNPGLPIEMPSEEMLPPFDVPMTP